VFTSRKEISIAEAAEFCLPPGQPRRRGRHSLTVTVLHLPGASGDE